ncbi:MAG: hypothetical protein ACR2QR_02700, partial [Woeseiaceae bacterium]
MLLPFASILGPAAGVFCSTIMPRMRPFIICSTMARCSGGMFASSASICFIASLICADMSSIMASS